MQAVKIKIINNGVLFFSLFLTLAVFSQISVAPPKPTSDVGLNKADWLYYKSNNDITAYLGKKSSNLPTVRYQKGADYLEFSMTGVSSSTSVSLETDVKTPNTPTLFYRNIFDNIDANYQITNIPFRVKEEIALKETFPTSLVGKRADLKFLFSAETSAKPVKQDDGSIAFFDDKGDYLFQLDKPFMIDANLNRSEAVSIEIKNVGHSVSNTTTNKKPIVSNGFFDALTGASAGIVNRADSLADRNVLSSNLADIKKLFYHKENFNQNRHRLSVLGPQQYTIILTADSKWLNAPNTTYPVIIDPTITHNADSNFTGQMNRIADNDSTSSTQLESSYGENANDPYTVLNLHFNEANGTTAGIRDYASTARVITANGNASTTSYVTQLGMGNAMAFDGTGDYLSIPDSDDWNFGSGDFTIETWVRFNTVSVSQIILDQDGAGAARMYIYFSATTGLNFRFANSATTVDTNQGNTNGWSTGVWYRLSIVRNGSNINVYRDGISIASNAVSIAGDDMAATLEIGRNTAAAGEETNGYLDDLRIIKGRALTPEEIKASASRRPNAVYTSSVLDASASAQWDTINWTEGGVKTGDGETLYNSSGLVAQWNFNETSGTTADNAQGTAALDGTLTNFASTASQDQAAGTGWTANNKKWGAGSLMFGSAAAADYVSISDPASNVLDPNSADLTIETWIKTSDTSAEIFSNNNANGTACTNNGYYLGIDANGYPVFYLDTNGATAGCDASTTSQFKINDGNWHKVSVAATRGTSAIIYVDGKSAGSDTSVTSYSAITVTGAVYFGGSAGGLDAILDSARFYSRALSAGEILSNYNAGNIELQTRTGATSDPNDGTWEAWKPTTGETQLLSMDSDAVNWNAPQQIDGYTKLLLHMDGADAATTFPNSATTTHTVTAVNQAQVDTAQSKFGGGSALFDGTGDYLSVPDSDDWYLSGDFTADFWARWNTVAAPNAFFYQSNNDGGNNRAWFSLEIGILRYYVNNGEVTDINVSVSWTPTAGQWYHLALVRNGNDFMFFVNGTQVGATQTDSSAVGNYTNVLFIGNIQDDMAQGMNGWIDEFRLSKGIARWTSNFTPPPRAYGSNVKAENETTIKQEGTASTKLTLGAPQMDGNTVALWHFEETGTTTGTYLYDETANNNDATTTGTTVVDGIFGKGRNFNGTSDYVSAGALTGGTAVKSVSFWVYPLTTTEYFVDLNGSAYVWVNAGTVTATGFTSPTIYVNGAVSSIVVAGQWQHITVTTGTGINASAPNIGKTPTNNFLEGKIDEVQISNYVLSADEIAETYRMGANHHLTRQVSAVDLSAQTKLAFWIAGDRPGTGLEAMLGESDHANYELASSTLALSTNTVLYIKGDEIASSTSIKDSSFSGKAITANGNARTSGNGKIGNALIVDGNNNFTTPDSDDFTLGGGNFSLQTWINLGAAVSGTDYIMHMGGATDDWTMTIDATSGLGFRYYNGSWNDYYVSWSPSTNNWYLLTITRSSNTLYYYINGQLVGTNSFSMTMGNPAGYVLNIGDYSAGSGSGINGYLDEVRILKSTALSADQIRQAYEYGLRSHQITIDFGATLQTSDLISSATDYNFSITATTSGLSATTSGLYLGDKIIIKENLGGTEYTAQGTVNAINTTTGAITVPSWDTGSTFPASNGYSPNATVFKWQREYFDLSGSLSTHRDSITNLTLRPTNGAEGRTIYLDDFRYNTNYLTASSSSAITSSNGRYLQYRAIFSSWDSFVSPFLSAFNTLYTSTANMFAPLIGISGGGFLSF